MEAPTTAEMSSKNGNNNQLVIIVGVAVIAIMLAGFIGYNIGQETGAERMHNRMDKMDGGKKQANQQESPAMQMKSHEDMTMAEMTTGLEGLTGDAFDKAFVEMMIVHHQGAVDMAKQIPGNAKHAELKKLGQDIIAAQTKEIEMMKGWLKSWGYENQGMMMDNMGGMDHSMMGR